LPKPLVREYNQSRILQNRNKPICLAPFKSLRFLPDGNITVCCHNNSFSLGKYPDTSIMSAWNSNELEFLRKKMDKADFSAGCQDCLSSFEEKQFASVNPLLYENYSDNSKFPVILDFKSATECNLMCVMCSEYSSSAIRRCTDSKLYSEASVYDKDFVEEIKTIIPHIAEARFSGGEPFLNDIYYDLWYAIIEKNPNCKISIQTNGTIYNSKVQSILESGQIHINVSVDAVDPELYQKIRINGNLEKVKENIFKFSEYSKLKNTSFGITACAMRDNAYELSEIFKLANSLGAKLWYSDVHFPLVNALWVMKSDELDKIVEFLNNQKLELNSEMSLHNAVVFKDLIGRIEQLALAANRREHSSKLLINPTKLVEKLSKVMRKSTLVHPGTWTKIKLALSQFNECKMIDLSIEISKYYNTDFAFQQLGQMSYETLIKNFACLIVD